MSASKRFRKRAADDNDDDDDDDVIIIEASSSPVIINEHCQHTDRSTGDLCQEFFSVLCMHCNLYLCFAHVDVHQTLLIEQRDQLVDEFNERLDQLNQLLERPDRLRTAVVENYEIKWKKKLSFLQRLSLEKTVDLKPVALELKQLFQPIRTVLSEQRCVSAAQIRKIQASFEQFDQHKLLLLNQVINLMPLEQSLSWNLFHLSTIHSPGRQVDLPVQRSSCHEMAASEDELLINDREHVLLFNLTTIVDETPIPELIEWKTSLDGKIVDLHYSSHFEIFFLLTDEKLFSYRRTSSLVCLYRFTSMPWSCTTMSDYIYLLFKYSLVVEKWTLDPASTSIRMNRQWNLNELISDCQHDQHLRSIRSNPSQNQLAILIEDDECRWRVALFDVHMNCLQQTSNLDQASTMDWNLVLSFITDRQLLIMDSTTDHIYLINIDDTSSTVESKACAEIEYPVNACTITGHGSCSQLVLKMIKPNSLKFCQI